MPISSATAASSPNDTGIGFRGDIHSLGGGGGDFLGAFIQLRLNFVETAELLRMAESQAGEYPSNSSGQSPVRRVSANPVKRIRLRGIRRRLHSRRGGGLVRRFRTRLRVELLLNRDSGFEEILEGPLDFAGEFSYSGCQTKRGWLRRCRGDFPTFGAAALCLAKEASSTLSISPIDGATPSAPPVFTIFCFSSLSAI